MKKYLIIFLFLSCKKEKVEYNVSCKSPTNDINISKSLILGKWIWVSELYRVQLTGQYILKTPQSEGYTKEVIALNNRLYFYRNNSFEKKYLYDLVKESEITNYLGDSANVLVFKDYNTNLRTNHVDYRICNDTLILNFQIRSSFAGLEKWVKVK